MNGETEDACQGEDGGDGKSDQDFVLAWSHRITPSTYSTTTSNRIKSNGE